MLCWLVGLIAESFMQYSVVNYMDRSFVMREIAQDSPFPLLRLWNEWTHCCDHRPLLICAHPIRFWEEIMLAVSGVDEVIEDSLIVWCKWRQCRSAHCRSGSSGLLGYSAFWSATSFSIWSFYSSVADSQVRWWSCDSSVVEHNDRIILLKMYE